MRFAPRRGHIPYWLIAASVAAALLAVLPIFAAIMQGGPGQAAVGHAFASAPQGLYAVVAQGGETEDRLLAIAADDESDVREIARVPHLVGLTSSGAVSPDGSLLALVTADSGTPSRPLAALLLVDLRASGSRLVATGIDYLQPPVWKPDGTAVMVTRTTGEGPLVDVQVLSVPSAGGPESVAGEASRVLGAYPVGFDGGGAPLWVVIDGRGSTLVRAGQDLRNLAPNITRDWRLSPDGKAIAFIEADSSGGLRYIQRLAPVAAGVSREQAEGPAGQALGVAWRPGSAEPTYGLEPAHAAPNAGREQRAAGFDVPLGYSPDGRLLAVQAWSGSSFEEAGSMEITLVGPSGRVAIPASRFYGWAAR
ncbi:MAG: hypothetical protein ACKVT1_13310 [Dehalococcoidia bacterium]